MARAVARRASLVLAVALGACGAGDSGPPPPAALPPGVTFTYPRDGQLDVPVATRMIFQLTDEVHESALAAGCSVAGNAVQGQLCVVGSSGPVSLSTAVLGPRRNILSVQAAGLLPGETYRVYLRPGLLPDADNLPAEAPLVTFRTRQADTAPGAPRLLAINDEDPAAFAVGGPALRLPVLDRASLRLMFSEALDERTVVPGSSVALRLAGANTAVAATVLSVGQHLVVDPQDDLRGDVRYELVLTGVADRAGNVLPTTTLSFTPVVTTAYEQVVALDQPGSPSGPSAAGEVETMRGGASLVA